MKYLFFDIECSVVNKTKAKICAFGYCLTDEQFHIIEKRDILINPQGGFHLTDRKGKQGLVLPYEYEKFKNYPTFPEYADEIYRLLEDEDTFVCGHASMNDVKYLNLESQRFSLRSFRFSFADTQFIYMNKIGTFSHQFGLGTIAEALGVEFTAHKAADDAYATMKIAEAICKEEGLSLPEVVEKYKISLGKIENYTVTQSRSVASQQAAEDAVKRKELREKARAEFHEYVDKNKRFRNKNGDKKHLKVSFSKTLELNGELCKTLLKELFEKGGYYCFRADECNVFVCEENEQSVILERVKEHGATVVTADGFRKILNGENDDKLA
ncbi:MAG: 3'-5' exonuclease [Clostridia bacterium]|nr:3'-5' exonuclease [Clostridia bacterium]